MNLIQLSEQLKDVPDSFLQNEVTNPTGAYPAYLVVSELTRRKRMRDNVAKQEPGTTVAEDVMGLNAIPQAAQSLAAQDVAMAGPPQQMPRQPQRMPMPPRPQPQPQQMADGGLVAFDNGGSVTIEDTQEELEEFQPPVKSGFQEFIGPTGEKIMDFLGVSGRSLLEAPGAAKDTITEYFSTDPKAIEEAQESLAERLKRIQGEEEGGIRVGRNIIRDSSGNIIPSGPEGRLSKDYLDNPEIKTMRERVASDPRNQKIIQDALIRQGLTPEQKGFPTFNLQKNAEKKEVGVGNAPDENNPKMTKIGQASKLKLENLKSSFKTDLDNINRINKDISEFLSKGKAPDELYQEGVDKYKKEIKNPLRFLKDEIQKEEKRIEKLKFDNLNDALIQAGAAILQSPGGQNLQWLGKGLEGFQKAYKEGRKDIVDAKKDLLQSRIAFAESENNYARGAEEAGLRSLQRGETFQTMGLQKLGTEKALFAENINTALSIAQAESGIGLDFAKAYYYRNPQASRTGELTAGQITRIENDVRKHMAGYAAPPSDRNPMGMNLPPSDPRYIAEERRIREQLTQEQFLLNQGKFGASLGQTPREIDVSGAFESRLAPPR